jgi:hypothetical protein
MKHKNWGSTKERQQKGEGRKFKVEKKRQECENDWKTKLGKEKKEKN